MKFPVTRFKSLTVALKELEPFVRNGAHLQTGKPFKRFGGLRSREVLANWLLCAAVNSRFPGRLGFCATADPIGGDGIIYDDSTGETWPTEHVLVPSGAKASETTIEERIRRAIVKKNDKGGAAYAKGKTLVVFLNSGGGTWFPNRASQLLPEPFHFEAAWVVGLHGPVTGAYVYGVTRLDLSRGNAPTWLVRIAEDFSSWTVEAYQ